MDSSLFSTSLPGRTNAPAADAAGLQGSGEGLGTGATPLMALHDVTISRGVGALVRQLSLQILPGQVWAVLGENGVGKSSLLAAMVDYLPVDAGYVELAGKPIRQRAPQTRARLLSWLPQYEPDTLSVTVLERVLLARHPFVDSFFRDARSDVEAAELALADVGLAGYENRLVRHLSGGERRRVGLAACLAQHTPLLLLDEPLSALDLRHQQQIIQRLQSVARSGAAVVWITHDPNQALMGSTHVLLLLGDGASVAGPVEAVLHADQLSRAYRTDVREIAHEGSRFFYVPPALQARSSRFLTPEADANRLSETPANVAPDAAPDPTGES